LACIIKEKMASGVASGNFPSPGRLRCKISSVRSSNSKDDGPGALNLCDQVFRNLQIPMSVAVSIHLSLSCVLGAEAKKQGIPYKAVYSTFIGS
jgi:hypothetical protein